MRTAATFLLLCVLGPIAAGGQEAIPPSPATSSTPSTPSTPATPAAPASPTAIPKDAATEWRVGICIFSSEGLSVDNDYLSYSLPLLLKNELSGLTTHDYPDAEKDQRRAFLLQGELAAAEKALTTARRDYDALLFNRVPIGAAERVSVAARLTAAQARLDFLHAMDPSAIDVAPRKPVTFPEGTGAGKLLPAPQVPPDVYCSQQGLDLLVSGSLQEVQGYLLLDIWAYDPLSKTRIFTSRNAATRDELYATMPTFGNEIARTILGRAWALVAYAPQPPAADLYVDGARVASGATPTIYLAPGTHEIRISATGYRDLTRSLELEPEKETRIEDSLEKEKTGEIAISSDPDGADLYVNSRWMGKTPLALDRPAVRSRGVLTLKGYYDLTFSVEPDSPAVLGFNLEKDVGPKDARQKQARDDFYAALTFFALSVPLPVFSYGMLIDSQVKQVDLAAQGLATAVSREQRTSMIWQGTYYVGVAVSVALFTWMVTRIVRYVRVADEIAG